MNDKPLNCVGIDPAKEETGKHDFKANGAGHAPEVPEGAQLQTQDKIITAEQVMQHLAQALTQIQATFPDFSFTLIGRNTANPGQDLILTRDDPRAVINVVTNAIKRRQEATNPKVIA